MLPYLHAGLRRLVRTSTRLAGSETGERLNPGLGKKGNEGRKVTRQVKLCNTMHRGSAPRFLGKLERNWERSPVI